MKLFFQLLHYELLIVFRQIAEWLNPVLFFIVVVSLFPLAVSPEPQMLQQIAPGVIWVSITLAILLALDNLFRADYEDGFWALWCLSQQPMTRLILVRIFVASLAIILPLLIALPLSALFFQMTLVSTLILFVTAVLTIPTLLLIGGLGVALTISLSRSGILVALIILPLYIPLIIFATSAVIQGGEGVSITAQLALLAAFAVLAVTFLPFIIAFCLRNAE